jgi:hypothetical protein
MLRRAEVCRTFQEIGQAGRSRGHSRLQIGRQINNNVLKSKYYTGLFIFQRPKNQFDPAQSGRRDSKMNRSRKSTKPKIIPFITVIAQ